MESFRPTAPQQPSQLALGDIDTQRAQAGDRRKWNPMAITDQP